MLIVLLWIALAVALVVCRIAVARDVIAAAPVRKGPWL